MYICSQYSLNRIAYDIENNSRTQHKDALAEILTSENRENLKKQSRVDVNAHVTAWAFNSYKTARLFPDTSED